MSKLWLVARHEFLSNLKRRSFLFASIGIPLLMIVIFFVIFTVTASNLDVASLGSIGYIDESGILAAQQGKPDSFQGYASDAEARAALDAGSIGAYFVVAQDYTASGAITIYARSDVSRELHNLIEGYLIANLGADLDPALLQRLQAPVQLEILPLDSGRTITEEGIIGIFIVPFVFVLVFSLGSQASSGYLMSSVVEEKSNRIMEILVTSITPFQLLAGKIVGLGALGLVQLAIWGAAGVVVAQLNRDAPLLQSLYIPPDLLVIGVVYFLLSYFLSAALLAGIGSVAASEQESRQIAGLVSLLFFVPFFFMLNFLTDPEGTIPVALSLFPFTAPISVILRLSFGTIPTAQLILSIAILLMTTVIVMWASARVFRWSLLMYGKRPSLRQIIGGLRSSQMQTTATDSQTSAPMEVRS
jgi:ABC-2 type transport system permease protein